MVGRYVVPALGFPCRHLERQRAPRFIFGHTSKYELMQMVKFLDAVMLTEIYFDLLMVPHPNPLVKDHEYLNPYAQ